MKGNLISFKKLFWQFATLMGLIILLASPLTATLQSIGLKHQITVPSAVIVVDANEIYPMFTCPCCGTPLNKEEPCCGAMTQMTEFIDKQIEAGTPKDEVVLATAQEFGLERLTNEADQKTLREQLLANVPKNAPRIEVTTTKKDLGTIRQSNGTVATEFLIKNSGESELLINKLSSSCGCTSASLIYQGQEGPRFYMAGHGFDEPDTNWQAMIAPGDEAMVKVYYDPTVHEDLIGPVTRTVSVHSSDPVDFETKLTITLNQEK